MEKRVILTADQAIKLLGKRKEIHTFANPRGMLLGADHSRKSLIEDLKNARSIEIGGDQCKAMGHGLVMYMKNEPLFIEVDKDELFELEKSLTV
jgi:hypothetical protein